MARATDLAQSCATGAAPRRRLGGGGVRVHPADRAVSFHRDDHLWQRHLHRPQGHADGAHRHRPGDAIFDGGEHRRSDRRSAPRRRSSRPIRRPMPSSPFRKCRPTPPATPPSLGASRSTAPSDRPDRLSRFPRRSAGANVTYIWGEVAYTYTPAIGYLVTGPIPSTTKPTWRPASRPTFPARVLTRRRRLRPAEA